MAPRDERLHLILLAGGRGLRADAGDLPPKQFRTTGRGPLFAVGLANLLTATAVPATVTVAVPDAWRDAATAALTAVMEPDGPPWRISPAGDTRTGSTRRAAETLAAEFAPEAADLVAVHDAARPFASGELLDRLVAAARADGAAIPGVPVADTVVQRDEAGAITYLPRPHLLAVQTPQVFAWEPFLAAHLRAGADGTTFTDDGCLLAAHGLPPTVVEGEVGNWKVTSDADWRRAAALLSG